MANFLLFTEVYVVGFAETMYSVIEGDNQVEVCVTLMNPKGEIFGGQILVEVFNNSIDQRNTPVNHTAASKLLWLHKLKLIL